MHAEVGGAPGSIFEAPARDAPGCPPPEDEGLRSEGKPRRQRLCTRARQRVRRGIVNTAMAPPDPTDPLRQAWAVYIPENFFTSLPNPETRASGMKVCFDHLHDYIEGPILVHHKGLVFRDRDSTGGPLFRTVDTFGNSLSMYLGAGHGRFTLYNELEDLPHRFALLVGMNACRQRTDVFSSAIDPGRREAWHTAQRKAAKQHRGGIIFDLFIRAFNLSSRNVGFVNQGCDGKTIGMIPKYYGGSVA